MAHPSPRTASLPGPSSHTLPSRTTVASPYSPHDAELRAGARNRLFLALRSSIDSEVDWALPRLVVGSFDHVEKFRLETWVDSVAALLIYPLKFLEQLERSSTLALIRDGQIQAPTDGVAALVGVDDWQLDAVLEKRASESLLVLRNASFMGSNAKLICRQTFISFIERWFGSIPYDHLLESTLKYPEITSHLLVIIGSILPYLHRPPSTLLKVFAQVLPRLLVDTRDAALIQLLLPILIHAGGLPNLPTIESSLIPHLLSYLTLSPPTKILDPILDLLFVLSSNPAYSRQVLSSKYIHAYLNSLIPLLSHGSRPYNATWESTVALAGRTVRNPASGAASAEEASRKRAREREMAQRRMESFGGGGVIVPVGDKPPVLSPAIKARLYTMPEPKRSIAWMHETFVYCSTSQLLQVIFWHAYRDFFQHPSTVEQLLSASEVIKNVTVAFPGASAKIWIDEKGEQKFVIAGMGFRKGSDDDDRFSCQWREWATRPSIPETITAHPSTSEALLASNRITSRPPPPLPRSVKLSFTGELTPTDSNRQPTGTPFLASLVIRNLARALRNEIQVEELQKNDKEEKKKHLLEERFGLPIPEYVLKEEEEEEQDVQKGLDEGLSVKERLRAVQAFVSIEERVLKVVEGNMNGLGRYLGEAFGW